jgi:flagellar biosynthesis/type III secretory pathway protein FliH
MSNDIVNMTYAEIFKAIGDGIITVEMFQQWVQRVYEDGRGEGYEEAYDSGFDSGYAQSRWDHDNLPRD